MNGGANRYISLVESRRAAAFVSAFVFPGGGQLLQRRWLAAAFFMLSFTAFFVVFIITVVGPLLDNLRYAVQLAEFGRAPPFEKIDVSRAVLSLLAAGALYFWNIADVLGAGRRRRTSPPPPPA